MVLASDPLARTAYLAARARPRVGGEPEVEPTGAWAESLVLGLDQLPEDDQVLWIGWFRTVAGANRRTPPPWVLGAFTYTHVVVVGPRGDHPDRARLLPLGQAARLVDDGDEVVVKLGTKELARVTAPAAVELRAALAAAVERFQARGGFSDPDAPTAGPPTARRRWWRR